MPRKISTIGEKSNRRKQIKSTPTGVIEESSNEARAIDEKENVSTARTILEEIVDEASCISYEKHIDKQTVQFLSRCSRLAWKALVEWEYQRKDRGGFGECGKEVVDTDPEPSPKDSWSNYGIPIVKNDEKKESSTQEPTKAPFSAVSSTYIPKEKPFNKLIEQAFTFEQKRAGSVCEARSVMKNLSRTFTVNSSATATRQKSEDRLHTTSKYRVYLPAKSLETFRDTYELPHAEMMQSKNFPPPRVQVRYVIAQGSRGFVSLREPSVKTINLQKSKSPKRLTTK